MARRLAIIRGPAEHDYAQERYQAYLDTLQAYGIPFDPALVSPHCVFELEAGTEAMQTLLDTNGLRPGPDLQAVVAVSDLALKALQARGMRVPGDLALVGSIIPERAGWPRRRSARWRWPSTSRGRAPSTWCSRSGAARMCPPR